MARRAARPPLPGLSGSYEFPRPTPTEIPLSKKDRKLLKSIREQFKKGGGQNVSYGHAVGGGGMGSGIDNMRYKRLIKEIRKSRDEVPVPTPAEKKEGTSEKRPTLEELAKNPFLSDRDKRRIALEREGLSTGTGAFAEGGMNLGKGISGIFNANMFGGLLVIVIVILLIWIVLQLFPLVGKWM